MASPDLAARLAAARLYFVSDIRPGGRPLLDVLEPALAAGVDVFQLRAKTADDATILAAAEEARAACRAAGALFVVNDRPDLAAAAGADGVHVGQDDTAVAAARATVGADALVGLSTHTPAQIDAAVAASGPGRADYIGVGPVYATPTKPGRPAVGLALVRHAAVAAAAPPTDAAATAALPWFAIGGVDAGTVDAVIDAGATRIVVVRAIAEAADPGAAARALRATLAVPSTRDEERP